jgi:hypothetical protein
MTLNTEVVVDGEAGGKKSLSCALSLELLLLSLPSPIHRKQTTFGSWTIALAISHR